MRKKVLSLLVLTTVFLNVSNALAGFPDVSEDHTNYDAINYVQEEGIVHGYPDGDFKPNNKINRAEFTKIIIEAVFDEETIESCLTENIETGSDQVFFPDVKKDDWFAQYVCTAKVNNIVNGYPDGTYQPAQNINLAEAAKIINEGFGFETEADETWYKPYVENLDAKKAIPTSVYGFDEFITRGEMAEMIYRLKADVTDKPSRTYAELAAGKIDDWAFEYPEYEWEDYSKSAPMPMSPAYDMAESAGDDLGFSTGGAKDINNFRDNIANDYLPLHTDLTYEGLYYDYYFDTGEEQECTELFCPSYTSAVSSDPFSNETEHYLSVGLNSNLKASDFERKKLNLVIVLDISGSMSSYFDSYYYDQFDEYGNLINPQDDEDAGKTKMEVATEAVVDLLGHLEDDDQFGMVLFDDMAYLGKPLSRVGDTDLEAIKSHILEIQPEGGTMMSEGMKMGTDLYAELLDVDHSVYENRIIFLTDAMPNLGDTSKEGLFGITESNAENQIYSTFIGIGVDFNTELIEAITKIRGANYYAVHSAAQFKERMDEGFDYMVTPLVFNLELKLDAPGYEIEKVYGSPEADEATGEIMKVNTLFPSLKQATETKGGLVILKLKKIGADPTLNLAASFEDRNGTPGSDIKTFTFENQEPEYFANNGIRKGILLARYVNLAKSWIIDERANYEEDDFEPLCDYEEAGLCLPPPEPVLGEWERQSIPLLVSDPYPGLFAEFKTYFEQEMAAIGDDSLSQEVEILEKLASYSN